MSTTLHPTAVVRGWAEGRLLPPRRIRRGHAGRLAPHFANVRPAKFVFSSGGGMGLREGAPEETHRDSHQPPVPSAVYNPHQGPPEGDDDVPNLFNNVVNNERGGRIRARASKWDSLRDELGGQAKTSFGMSLGDPLGKNGAHGSRSATEATRGDGETSDDDPPPATGKAPEPAEELEELLMSKMRTTRPTGEAPASNSAKPASEKTQFSKTNEDAAKKKKGDKFSAAVEIKAKKREEKDKLKKKKDTKDDVKKQKEDARVLAYDKKDWGRSVVESAEVLFLCAAGGIKAAQAYTSSRELSGRSSRNSSSRGVNSRGTVAVATSSSAPPARPPAAVVAQFGWAADGALIGALAASAFLRRTGASNNVVSVVNALKSSTATSTGDVVSPSAVEVPAPAPAMAAADLESVIERVRAKSKRLREELSASRMEAAKAAEAAVKAAAASPGSSAVEPDKLKDVLKAVNLALEEKDEMEKAVQLQKAAMEATARAEAAEMMAQDNARRAQMAEEREEKIAGVFSKEADRALESLRYLSSLQETQRLETWTTETTVRRTGPGPFPPGFNPDAAAAAAAAQQQQQQQQPQQQQQQRRPDTSSLGAGQDRGYIEAFDVELDEADSDDEENVRRGL